MAWWQWISRGAVSALLVLAAACTGFTVPGGAPAPVEKQPPSTVVVPPATVPPAPPRAAPPAASAAWQPLLAKAEQATQRGDYEQALALLERAQRIDPDSAAVYLAMARTHRARGDAAQARATAERGLLYCATETQCSALRAFTR